MYVDNGLPRPSVGFAYENAKVRKAISKQQVYVHPNNTVASLLTGKRCMAEHLSLTSLWATLVRALSYAV